MEHIVGHLFIPTDLSLVDMHVISLQSKSDLMMTQIPFTPYLKHFSVLRFNEQAVGTQKTGSCYTVVNCCCVYYSMFFYVLAILCLA